MVSLETAKFKTIRWWRVGVGSVLIAVLVVALGFVIAGKSGENTVTGGDSGSENTDQSAEISPVITEVDEEKTEEPEKTLPVAVAFQPVVDEWVSSAGGNKGVVIYDIDREEVVAEYNSDEEFQLASVYKLFVVYEGYRKVARGEWKLDDKADYLGRTVGECLDAAIRSSDSTCAETLWAMMGVGELVEAVNNDYGIAVGDSIMQATPRQVMQMMLRFYEHPDFGVAETSSSNMDRVVEDTRTGDAGSGKDANAMISQMWDSFLNQPVTEYNWRQGLPSGFSEEVRVYNKVGWQWDEDEETGVGSWFIYNDAAIVEFPEINRRFIVVALTNGVGFRKIAELGSMIEEKVLAEFSP